MQQHEAYKRRNRDERSEIQRRYREKYHERLKKDARERYHANIQKSRDKGRKTRERMRDEIFDILGRRCVVCGFADIRALQFDHINGGGNEDNKQRHRETRLIYMRNNPDETKSKFQVLCANCNSIKRHFKGENVKINAYPTSYLRTITA